MGDKVLLADDSATIQKLVEMALSDSGYELLAVSDGKQALDHMATFRPDVVLADAIMPIMDGYQVCQHVKQDPHFQHIPVILLTGRFQPFDSEKAAEVGIDDRVVKPFSQDQLVGIIEKLLAQSKEAAPAAVEDDGEPTGSEDQINTMIMDEPEAEAPVSPGGAANETVAFSPEVLEQMARAQSGTESEVEELPSIDDFDVDDEVLEESPPPEDEEDEGDIDDVTMELTTEDLADIDADDLSDDPAPFAEADTPPAIPAPQKDFDTGDLDFEEDTLMVDDEGPDPLAVEPVVEVEEVADQVEEPSQPVSAEIDEEPAEPADLLDDTDEMLVTDGDLDGKPATEEDSVALDTEPVDTAAQGVTELDTEPVDTLLEDDLLKEEEEPFPVEEAPEGQEIPTEEMDGPILEELEDDLAEIEEGDGEGAFPEGPTSASALSEAQLDVLADKVAERLIHKLGEDQVREVVWEVVPELAEAMVKKRIYQLEQEASDRT